GVGRGPGGGDAVGRLPALVGPGAAGRLHGDRRGLAVEPARTAGAPRWTVNAPARAGRTVLVLFRGPGYTADHAQTPHPARAAGPAVGPEPCRMRQQGAAGLRHAGTGRRGRRS